MQKFCCKITIKIFWIISLLLLYSRKCKFLYLFRYISGIYTCAGLDSFLMPKVTLLYMRKSNWLENVRNFILYNYANSTIVLFHLNIEHARQHFQVQFEIGWARFSIQIWCAAQHAIVFYNTASKNAHDAEFYRKQMYLWIFWIGFWIFLCDCAALFICIVEVSRVKFTRSYQAGRITM